MVSGGFTPERAVSEPFWVGSWWFRVGLLTAGFGWFRVVADFSINAISQPFLANLDEILHGTSEDLLIIERSRVRCLFSKFNILGHFCW